ncbi:hypothetical protein [Peribacillus kribbensis]|uniref:hypothetical protein n=1 Tax=Peribacillus kribbensis TaxID=356658 RepID=UPI00041D5880|nr:hypothetical protein [Peribacillus kribbensis]
MRKTFIVLAAIISEILLTLLAASFFHVSFSEISFFIGLGITLVIYVFSSNGGIFSDYLKTMVRSDSDVIWVEGKEEDTSFHPSWLFLGSVIFTTFSLVWTAGYYWSYF